METAMEKMLREIEEAFDIDIQLHIKLYYLEKEKQQIIEAYNAGSSSHSIFAMTDKGIQSTADLTSAEQYYNETFKKD